MKMYAFLEFQTCSVKVLLFDFNFDCMMLFLGSVLLLNSIINSCLFT